MAWLLRACSFSARKNWIWSRPPTHRHMLQFGVGHVDITNRIGEPHQVDHQERHQAHPASNQQSRRRIET